MFGESVDFVLVPYLGAVDVNVEDAARTFDQNRLDVILRLDCVRQTGGSGQVVSLGAVLDADPHGCYLLIWIQGGVLPVRQRGVRPGTIRRAEPSSASR